jgi:hypothetical protein
LIDILRIGKFGEINKLSIQAGLGWREEKKNEIIFEVATVIVWL